MTIAYENYVVSPETGCWDWQGYVDSNGYGRLYEPSKPVGKRTVWAHRAFYERSKGPIPERHEIDHTCQNTICVNPDHLEAVTKAEHAWRTHERLGIHEKHRLAAVLRSSGLSYAEIAKVAGYAGRTSARDAVMYAIEKGLVDAASIPKGRRLSSAEKADIRLLYELGVPQTELAEWYGLDSSYISRVCARLDTKAARRQQGYAA